MHFKTFINLQFNNNKFNHANITREKKKCYIGRRPLIEEMRYFNPKRKICCYSRNRKSTKKGELDLDDTNGGSY